MAAISFEIEGAAQVAQVLRDGGERGIHAMKWALVAVGTSVMQDSKRLVPVDTTALRSSGFVSEIRGGDRTALRVEVGYGGPAARYATIVHENLTAYHPVGQAKFLEIPFRRKGGFRDFARFARIAWEKDRPPILRIYPTSPWGRAAGGNI